ncbi:MAG: hypothetical protein EOO12_14050 [Chitinophagaceae bacterium]|nr:MAG: hypothetical protein EOO12_14050 [Chitinophagaceae bacterium]
MRPQAARVFHAAARRRATRRFATNFGGSQLMQSRKYMRSGGVAFSNLPRRAAAPLRRRVKRPLAAASRNPRTGKKRRFCQVKACSCVYKRVSTPATGVSAPKTVFLSARRLFLRKKRRFCHRGKRFCVSEAVFARAGWGEAGFCPGGPDFFEKTRNSVEIRQKGKPGGSNLRF